MTVFAEIVDDEVTLEKMRQKRGRRKWKRYDPDVILLYFCSPDYPVPPEVRARGYPGAGESSASPRIRDKVSFTS